MVSVKEFKINEYLTLRLENGYTNIYVADRIFNQCKYLILNIPVEEIEELDELESIDEAAESLDHSLEGLHPYGYGIPPDTEFWAHCSNLQAWFENGYDTRLLHRNLAFSLLERLTDVGDPLARKVFKDELSSRYLSGFMPVRLYFLEKSLLRYLTREELQSIVNTEDLEQIRENFFYDDLHGQLIIAYHYVQLGMNQRAINIINFVKAYHPEEYELWYLIANIYGKLYSLEILNSSKAQEYITLAISSMQRVLEAAPSDFYEMASMTRLAFFYISNKDFELAERYLEESLNLNRDYWPTWDNLGELYKSQKRYKKAIEMYLQAYEIDPYMKHIYGNIAECYYYDKNYAKCIKYAKKQLARNSMHYEALYFLGSCCYKSGNYQKAVNFLSLALDCDEWFKSHFTTTDVFIWKKLGKIYYHTKNYEKALSFLQKVVAHTMDNQKYVDLINTIKK